MPVKITSDMIYGYTDGIILRILADGDSYGYDLNAAVLEKSGMQSVSYTHLSIGLTPCHLIFPHYTPYRYSLQE